MFDPCYNLTLYNTSCLFILRNHVTDQNKSPKNSVLHEHNNIPIHVYNVIPIQVPPVIL